MNTCEYKIDNFIKNELKYIHLIFESTLRINKLEIQDVYMG